LLSECQATIVPDRLAFCIGGYFLKFCQKQRKLLLFTEKLNVQHAPQEVVIDFAESRMVDVSTVEALNKRTARHQKASVVEGLSYKMMGNT
jgi:hypothetical protein